MPTMPAADAPHLAHARGRQLRRLPAGDHPRLQVRRPALDCVTARRADAASWRSGPRRRRRGGTRAAARLTAPRPRVRSGARSGPSSWQAGRARSAADAENRDPGEPARGQAPRQRSGCVRAHVRRGAARRAVCRAGGRRQHDGGDARSVRARAYRLWCTRGAGAYSCSSRDITALSTSAAIASLGRSPSSRTQASACARRW